jgi:hypothetical protein
MLDPWNLRGLGMDDFRRAALQRDDAQNPIVNDEML